MQISFAWHFLQVVAQSAGYSVQGLIADMPFSSAPFESFDIGDLHLMGRRSLPHAGLPKNDLLIYGACHKFHKAGI